MLTAAESTWGTSPSVIRIRSSSGPRQASRGLLILGQHQGHVWNLRSTTKRVFPKKGNLRAWAPILPHQQQNRRLPDTGALLAGWCPRPPIRLRLWIEMRREKSPPLPHLARHSGRQGARSRSGSPTGFGPPAPRWGAP